MAIGPFPERLWEVISSHPRYYERLGFDKLTVPARPNLQAVARLLEEAHDPEGYSVKRATSTSASFKTGHRRGQIKGFFVGDPKYRAVGLEIMDCLHLRAEEIERIMGVGDQIVDHRHLTVRVGALADIVEMERLGRRVLKARQSSVSDMTSRMTKRLEHSFVVEDGSSGLLRGFLRWWVLSPQGVARILKGEALNGGELCRPSDRTKTRPFGALYIVMILGVDQVAGCRITLEARKLVNEFAKEGLPTFTRPSTWSGLMMVKRPSFRFSRVKQPGSRIFVREAKT